MPWIEDLVTYAILIAIVAAFVLMVTGKFFDLSVERQISTESRAAINLLQKIVTDGPFLMEDSNGNKLKLMIDKSKYADPKNSDLSGCCESVQYNYKFAIGRFTDPEPYEGETGKIYTVDAIAPVKGNYNNPENPPKFDTSDRCYNEFGIGTSTGSEVPVNICNSGDINSCEQGIAKIEVVDSPLSQLSYWITQICKSDYDTSKRIPLSTGDFVTGSDITVNNLEKTVCLRGTCKKFVCDKDIEYAYDSDLLNEKIYRFPETLTCHFTKVAREGGKYLLYKGVGDIEVPEGAEDLPKDHDAWTEKEPEKHFDPESSLQISTDKVKDIEVFKDSNGKSEGSSYVVFRRDAQLSQTVHDLAANLTMSKVPGHETLDCDETCVNMLGRGFDRIVFRAMVYSGRTEKTVGQLTWKLYDSVGNCIQKRYVGAGNGKELVYGNRAEDWSVYVINYASSSLANQRYGSCKSDWKNEPETFPPTFDWRITKIGFSVCETTFPSIFGLTKSTCIPAGGDEIKVLLVDNLYFGVANK